MRLSRFSNYVNDLFGSWVAIPNGPDYPYLRKIFGEKFDPFVKIFKGTESVVTNLEPHHHNMGITVEGRELRLINLTNHSLNHLKPDSQIEFQHKDLPTIKLTRTENEAFTFFHELGHAVDGNAIYPTLGIGSREKEEYWLKENFADFFASALLIKATGGSDIVRERILPLRALSGSFAYQTTFAIEWAIEIAKKYDFSSLSEGDLTKIMVSEWNNSIMNFMPDMHSFSRYNTISAMIASRCIGSGGVGAYLETIEEADKLTVLEHLGAFNTKFVRPLASNAYAFKNPMQNLAKIQLTLAQPLDTLLKGLVRERTYDGKLGSYFAKYPENPMVLTRQTNLQHSFYR